MSKIRIGFVGVGQMGQMAHLANYVAIEACQVVALAEVRPELGRLVAERYGIGKVYRDHREMLAAEQLDAVVASQPFAAHASLLPELYDHVKHLFTEKPLAVSAQAGERLAAQAEQAGCIHMVGYHKRCDPAVIRAKETIDQWRSSGEMGPLKYVRITMPPGDWIAGGFDGLVHSDEPRPSIASEPAPSDMDQATYKHYVGFVNYYIHQVNLMRHLLGEPYRVAYADPSGVLIATESDSGVSGVIETSPYRTTLGWKESALVAFERGYVRIRLPAPLAVNRAGSVEIYADPGDGQAPQRTFPTMPPVHAMHQQAINFVQVCRGKMAPPCAAAEAVDDLDIARNYITMLQSGG